MYCHELCHAPQAPVTEAELQAYVNRQFTPARQRDIQAYLARRPEEAQRVENYLTQKRELRALFNPVLEEPLPQRLRLAGACVANWMPIRARAWSRSVRPASSRLRLPPGLHSVLRLPMQSIALTHGGPLKSVPTIKTNWWPGCPGAWVPP